MPKATEKDRVKRWQERVGASNRVQEAWYQKYKCKKLEDYRLGHQNEDPEVDRYVINLCFPTIETRMPALLYYYPYFQVGPRNARADDPNSEVQERAKLREDTLNSYVSDPDFGFLDETSLGLLEVFSMFCVVEVGYSADYIDNPDAGKPVLKENSTDPLLDKEGQTIPQGQYKVNSEQLYIKRIPAKNFRVSANQNNRLERCDWVGYFEWHYPEDLKKNKRYKNTATVKTTGKVSDSDHAEDVEAHKDMVKVWKLWSLRADKQRVVFTEGGEKFLLEETYDIFPFEALKFHEITDQWYPLPPMFNWLSPQDEMNDCRQMQKNHRRRANRRYQVVSGGVDTAELDKLEDQDKDFQLVTVNYKDAITPIQDAPLDGAIERAIPNSKEDFREMSGEGGEQLGVAGSETATQANIIDFRARIRETFDRVKVARWLGRIGKKLLMLMEDRMALNLWIKRNVDPFAPNASEEAQRVGYYWKQINIASEFGELDCDVTVDVESLSPVTQDTEREAFNQAIAAITNPAVAMLFVADQSGVLLKKFLKYYRITNQREVQAIGEALAAIAMAQAAQAAAPKGGGDSSAQPQGASPGPTPSGTEIEGQLQEQMPELEGVM